MVAPQTTANVNITWSNNTSLLYSFQFGTLGDTSWNFAHKSFYTDIKTDPSETPLISFSSVSSPPTIEVTDEVNRILNYNGNDLLMRNALSSGQTYTYDLLMIDETTGDKFQLMAGSFIVVEGTTKPPGEPTSP